MIPQSATHTTKINPLQLKMSISASAVAIPYTTIDAGREKGTLTVDFAPGPLTVVVKR